MKDYKWFFYQRSTSSLSLTHVSHYNALFTCKQALSTVFGTRGTQKLYIYIYIYIIYVCMYYIYIHIIHILFCVKNVCKNWNLFKKCWLCKSFKNICLVIISI